MALLLPRVRAVALALGIQVVMMLRNGYLVLPVCHRHAAVRGPGDRRGLTQSILRDPPVAAVIEHWEVVASFGDGEITVRRVLKDAPD